ncbi:MAG: hypothetical protein IGR92_01875 [Leptolyngbyaceae cyanobacterium T60_A2020_046]|nr:hypothetical protein [Leptolyngbyaceae cyanobacterium T60_A2020_046]
MTAILACPKEAHCDRASPFFVSPVGNEPPAQGRGDREELTGIAIAQNGGHPCVLGMRSQKHDRWP